MPSTKRFGVITLSLSALVMVAVLVLLWSNAFMAMYSGAADRDFAMVVLAVVDELPTVSVFTALLGIVAAVWPRLWPAVYWVAYAGLWVIAMANIIGTLHLSLLSTLFNANPLMAFASYAFMVLPVVLMAVSHRLR